MTAALHEQTIRLLLVDDHKLMRRGLAALLGRDTGLRIVAEAADAKEAIEHARTLQPDVVLLDNHMPGVSGVAALPELRAAAPAAIVLMLTVSEDAADLAAALQGGAAGYLLKTMDGDELGTAIRRAVAGDSVIAPEMTAKLVQAWRSATNPTAPAPAAGTLDVLSPRERDILRGIARGHSNKEIARDLGIAETTVKIHVQHILRKLDLNSRVQAAVLATQNGLT